MSKYYKNIIIIMITVFSIGSASISFAAEPLLDRGKFSIGGGVSTNDLNGISGSEVGFQFFGAYNLNQINLMDGVRSSVEAGYMDYGFNTESGGIWGSYVVDGNISGQFRWLARLGYDFGDDNGLLIGGGLGFVLNQKMGLRFEYVVRDNLDSLQFNFIYNI